MHRTCFSQQSKKEKVHKDGVKIRCFTDSCDNVLEHEYPLDNWSPRIDGKCSKCGHAYSVKVASL